MKQDLMKGVIDMHVHTNPDLRLRAYDDFELMEAAIRVGARAIVIKTHQGTTMDRAYLCNRHNEIVHGKTNNFTMFGSISLNSRRHQSEGSRCGTSPGSKGGMASDPVGEEPYAEDEPGSEPKRGGRKRWEDRSGASFRAGTDPRPQCGTGNRSHRTGGDFHSCGSCTGYGSKKHRCNPS